MPLDSEYLSEVSKLTAVAVGLEEYRNSIQANGMSREMAATLETYSPGILKNYPINAFTLNPSTTKKQYALESIDWVRAGVVTAIIGTVLTGLYKLLKWIYNKVVDYLKARQGEPIESVEKAEDAVNVAMANAREEPPVNPTSVNNKYRKLLKLLSKPGAHLLNPIIHHMIVEGTNRGVGDDLIKSACAELDMLYSRLQVINPAIYMALADDMAGRHFSALLRVCDATGDSKTNMYDIMLIRGASDIMQSTYDILHRVEILAKAVKRERFDNIGNYMSGIEETLIDVVNQCSKRQRTISTMTLHPTEIKDMDGGLNSGSAFGSKFEVREVKRITDMIEEIDKYDDITYSIWNGRAPHNADIRSPIADIRWFIKLSQPETLRAVKLMYDQQSRAFIKTMDEIQYSTDSCAKNIENISKEIDSLKGKPILDQSISFEGPYGHQIEFTPIEQMQRTINIVRDINKVANRQLFHFLKLDHALTSYTRAMQRGAENYTKLLSLYGDKQA